MGVQVIVLVEEAEEVMVYSYGTILSRRPGEVLHTDNYSSSLYSYFHL